MLFMEGGAGLLTTVLALLCLIVIFSLYIGTGGWKTHGGLKGIFTWMRSAGTPRLAQQSPVPAPMGSELLVTPSDEVEEILDDIYREFTEETGKLREQFELFQQETHERFESLTKKIHTEIAQVALQVEQLLSSSQKGDRETQMSSDISSEVAYRQPELSTGTSLSSRIELQSDRFSAPLENLSIGHFEVLDYLFTGASTQEISQITGISEEQVEEIRKLMENPLHADESSPNLPQ